MNNMKETSYELPKIGRKYKNKCENNEVEDNQDKKKLKSNKTNLENTIQRLLEQQEARQIESEKKEKSKEQNYFKRSSKMIL